MSVNAQGETPSAEKARAAAQAIWEELEREDAGDSPPPETAAPESVAPPQPETKPEAAPDDDRALLKQIPELMQLVKSTAGRVGSLQSELTKLGQAAAKQQSGSAPTDAAISKAATDLKKWQQLKEDFPDWAEGVEAFVAARAPSTQAPAINLDYEVGRRLAKAREEDAVEIVTLFDEGWRDKVKTPEFAEWLKQQPAEYQARALSSWRPTEIVRTLRDFESARAPKGEQRQAQTSRLQSAAMPRTTGRVNIQKPVEEMTPQEYWAFLEAEDERKARASR